MLRPYPDVFVSTYCITSSTPRQMPGARGTPTKAPQYDKSYTDDKVSA